MKNEMNGTQRAFSVNDYLWLADYKFAWMPDLSGSPVAVEIVEVNFRNRTIVGRVGNQQGSIRMERLSPSKEKCEHLLFDTV